MLFRSGVANILVHPMYKDPLVYYDVAVLKMNESVSYSQAVYPICLPEKPVEDTNLHARELAYLDGWGKQNLNDPNPSDVLRSVKLSVYSDQQCNRSYSQGISGFTALHIASTMPQLVQPSLLCAGLRVSFFFTKRKCFKNHTYLYCCCCCLVSTVLSKEDTPLGSLQLSPFLGSASATLALLAWALASRIFG